MVSDRYHPSHHTKEAVNTLSHTYRIGSPAFKCSLQTSQLYLSLEKTLSKLYTKICRPGSKPELSYDQAFPKILVPTGLALLLCNMDRIVMSVAILPIAKEFSWAPSTQVSLAN